MTLHTLNGLNATNPLDFMAAIGLLQLLHAQSKETRPTLHFLSGGYIPVIESDCADLASTVQADAIQLAVHPSWWAELEYEQSKDIEAADGSKKGKKKKVKRGETEHPPLDNVESPATISVTPGTVAVPKTKSVADIKVTPERFEAYLHHCATCWKPIVDVSDTLADYATAFGAQTSDGMRPTDFHFLSGQQQFLVTAEEIRAFAASDRKWIQHALFEGTSQKVMTRRRGANLRWDPSAERNYALMASNPAGKDEGTSVNAPLEWLAFRALASFPTFPSGRYRATTAIRYIKGAGAQLMTWPLWQTPVTLAAARYILQMDWPKLQKKSEALRERGVFAVCSAQIYRSKKQYGNFRPTSVQT